MEAKVDSRYAVDILAFSDTEFHFIMEKVKWEWTAANKAETKVVIIDCGPTNIKFRSSLPISVPRFTINKWTRMDKEFRRRKCMAQSAITKLTRIRKDTDISKNIKLKLIRTLIYPVTTYISETWSMNMDGIAKKNWCFEMWVYRRTLRISWMRDRTNNSILHEMKVSTRLSRK